MPVLRQSSDMTIEAFDALRTPGAAVRHLLQHKCIDSKATEQAANSHETTFILSRSSDFSDAPINRRKGAFE